MELLRDALRIGRIRVPGELGDPEPTGPRLCSVPELGRRVEQHCASSRGRAPRCRREFSRGASARLRCTGGGPRCRSERALAHRLRRRSRRQAHSLRMKSSGEISSTWRSSSERRRPARDHHVVRADRVDRVVCGVHHAAVDSGESGCRAVGLRRQVREEVRLVPDLPVAHAREPLVASAVAPRGGGHEVGEVLRAWAGRARDRASTLCPPRRRLDIDDGGVAVPDSELHARVECRPVVRARARVTRCESRGLLGSVWSSAFPIDKEAHEASACTSEVGVALRRIGAT